MAVDLELRIRRLTVDEALPKLDRYLNDAYLANLSEIRIIHGIGTGAICKAVRDILSSHPLVESFRAGKQGEGGDGATIVRL